jgi:hypothetical protein
MTQLEFAIACNWSASRQCNYEAGQEASIPTLRIIAGKLKTTLAELLRIEDNWRDQVSEIKKMDKELRQRKKAERKSPWQKKRRTKR